MITLLAAYALIKDAECRIACRSSAYDTGIYKSNYCLCIDYKLYSVMTEKKLLVFPKSNKNTEHTGTHDYSVRDYKLYKDDSE